jgi:ABC-type phosphate transport system substrate-binding protein
LLKQTVLLLILTVGTLSGIYVSGGEPEKIQNFFKDSRGSITVSASPEMTMMMQNLLFAICSVNNNITAKVNKKNYAKALTDLQGDKSDFALVDHKPTFLAEKCNDWGVIYYAATAVVIVTNEANKVSGFNTVELAKIFSQKILTWEKFTGDKNGIHLIGLYKNRRGGEIFRNIVMNGEPISRYFFPVSTGSEVDIIISSDKNAVGFRMYSKLTADTKVKLVAINGVKPEPAMIINGKYPLTIHYYLCYNKKSKNPLVAKFIKYIKTVDFSDKIIKAGLLPTLDVITKK